MSVSTAFGVVFEQEPMLDATFIAEFSSAVLATFTGSSCLVLYQTVDKL